MKTKELIYVALFAILLYLILKTNKAVKQQVQGENTNGLLVEPIGSSTTIIQTNPNREEDFSYANHFLAYLKI